ncbi:MAG: hypothetical protein LBT31_02100, partial [Synergistaceae bacterium]|nr:hypothetical protein [Synergistaceae bacterium]
MSTDSNLQNNYDASRQNYSRTLLLSLLTFTLLAFFSLVPVASVFADSNFAGEGNEASPFLISDAEGLAKLAQLVNASGTNATYKVKHYKLTSDIDLSGYQADVGWAPIGTNVTYNFSGTFDGDYHKITGLVIKNASTNNQGVFGYLNGGVVKNLGVENADVEGKENVGGIAGYAVAVANASITNCYTSGVISGTYAVGGIVGYVATNSSVRNCYSTSNVTGTTSNVGGVVGLLPSTGGIIENCFSQGVVIGNSYVGGVVGRIYHASASVTNCVALNPSVSAMSASTYYLGHVSGGTTGTLTNSYYRSDMVKGEESNNDFNNSKDGTSTEQTGTASFWTGTVNWDGDTIWSFKD